MCSLPHARGGVSPSPPRQRLCLSSSPRPWGCFRGIRHGFGKRFLFPTPVGVFLTNRVIKENRETLPHARGGVSGTVLPIVFSGTSSPRPWGCFRKGRERTALNSDRTEEESAAMAASSRRTSAFSNLCSFHALIFAKKRVIYTETKNFN